MKKYFQKHVKKMYSEQSFISTIPYRMKVWWTKTRDVKTLHTSKSGKLSHVRDRVTGDNFVMFRYSNNHIRAGQLQKMDPEWEDMIYSCTENV